MTMTPLPVLIVVNGQRKGNSNATRRACGSFLSFRLAGTKRPPAAARIDL